MAKEKELVQQEMETKPIIPGLDKVKDTKYTKLKDKIEMTMKHLKDLATLEIMLDVSTRLKHRLESIKKMGSAKSIKVAGHWKTTKPQIYIMGLEGRKLSNNTCEIRFSVFETDEKGNKKLYVNHADVTLHDGSTIKRPTSAEYRIAYDVIEIIEFRKPIKREIMKVGVGDR